MPRIHAAKVTLALLLAALLGVSLAADDASACAPAPAEGARVDIVGEDALIVWDEARRIQHFIRRADFRTASEKKGARGRGFGFLVPTPSKPELAEAPDEVFARLDAAIRPETVHSKRYEVVWFACMLTRAAQEAAVAGGAPPVRVLATQTVAGFDAAILEADEAGALAKWLADHGYAFRPELADWLAVYVAAKWKITAFKISESPDSDVVGSSAVRMSFTSDKPFFPYREPTDQARGMFSRALRVFFVAPWRAAGELGKGEAWPGQLLHAAPLERAAEVLDGALPAAAPAEGAWLSYFIDHSSPRPGKDDLFFDKGATQEVLRLPPIVETDTVTIPLLLDVVGFVALLAGGAVMLSRRKKRA